MAEPPVTFAGILRKLRAEARLTQEELAETSGVRPRTVSDLERGVATTPQRETIRRLADALNLIGLVRAEFEAVARGRPAPAGPGAAGVGGVAAATRTLPRDIASFTGRQRELQDLVDATADAAEAGGVVSIHAIGGMAGVGKTAFAVHVAHRLAGRFPDGQIFLPLHGHTPGQRPVDPADALASLLLTAGVPAGQIPPGLEARTALWRDRLAERQLLLVLDDAASSEQVRPLLPGAGGSLVLVTSRRHLSALEDLTAISLGVLAPGEAAALLVRLIGRPGLIPADPAVGETIRLCGFLPLAIGMVARQLHHHPAWSLTDRAAELAAARDRLELMATENVSVAAAFNLSYEDLAPRQQRLFRRLGLHPGDDVDAYAAAALDDTDLASARGGLEALYDQYLLTELTQGRYGMHDLVRRYARGQAAADPADGEQALERLLDYYQHTAQFVQALLVRQPRTSPVPAPASPPPAAVPGLKDRNQALAWLRGERANLLACVIHASQVGQHDRVVALTAAVGVLLRLDGPWSDAITLHAAAAKAANQLGDRLGEAGALSELGAMRRLTGDHPSAAQALDEALGIYRDLGDRPGEAGVLIELAAVRGQTGDYPGATAAAEEALRVCRDLGDRLGQAKALNYLAVERQRPGDFPAAAQALEEALIIFRDLDDTAGQANALTDLGIVLEHTGDYLGAARAQEEALRIARDAGNRLAQANALTYLGDVRRLTGDYPGAARAQEDAVGIYRDLGDRLGQAGALGELGVVRRLTGDYLGAVQSLEAALSISRSLGERLGVANALSGLGAVRRLTGEHPRAAQALEEALGIYRDLGIRSGEVEALNETGTLYRVQGDVERAEECHRRAADMAREIASPRDEAQALVGLGRCALAAGRTADAVAALRLGREIFQRIDAVEAADVSRELDALAEGEPTA